MGDNPAALREAERVNVMSYSKLSVRSLIVEPPTRGAGWPLPELVKTEDTERLRAS